MSAESLTHVIRKDFKSFADLFEFLLSHSGVVLVSVRVPFQGLRGRKAKRQHIRLTLCRSNSLYSQLSGKPF